MYGFFLWEYLPFGRLWLDRFLIDARYQGKGYGRAALSLLIAHLTQAYPKQGKIYLSVVQGNVAAIRL